MLNTIECGGRHKRLRTAGWETLISALYYVYWRSSPSWFAWLFLRPVTCMKDRSSAASSAYWSLRVCACVCVCVCVCVCACMCVCVWRDVSDFCFRLWGFHYIIFLWRITNVGSESSSYRGLTITLRHTTIGRTPSDEWSDRRRDLYLITHNTH